MTSNKPCYVYYLPKKHVVSLATMCTQKPHVLFFLLIKLICCLYIANL